VKGKDNQCHILHHVVVVVVYCRPSIPYSIAPRIALGVSCDFDLLYWRAGGCLSVTLTSFKGCWGGYNSRPMYFPEAGALRPPAPPCTFFSVSASVFHRAGGRLLQRRSSHPPRPAVRACTTSSSSVAVHLTLRYCLNQQPHLVLALRSAFRWFGFMASWNPMWRGPGALLPPAASVSFSGKLDPVFSPDRVPGVAGVSYQQLLPPLSCSASARPSFQI